MFPSLDDQTTEQSRCLNTASTNGKPAMTSGDLTKIFAITQDLRTQAAFCFPKEYYDKYEFPVLPVVERAEDVATNVLIDRIWFAFIVKFPFFIVNPK